MAPAEPNISANGSASLFQLFAQLDAELQAAFPGLWLALMGVHGVIFLAGLALNGLALFVFLCRTRARTPSVIYTLNLVVTDLLVGLSLPMRFLVLYGAPGCPRCAVPHVFGYCLNMLCSVLFLTCICGDRYLAIVRPDGARRWRQPACARAVCVGVWLAAGAVTLSLLGAAKGEGLCCRALALALLGFVLPLLLLSTFTGRMLCALARPGLLPQGRRRRARAMQLLLTVLVIFLLCFTPFHARQLAVALWPDVPRLPSLVAYHVAVTLSSLNSCLDPIVYCFVTSGFQATVRNLLGRSSVDGEPSSGDAVGMAQSAKGTGTCTPPAALTSRPEA